MSLLDEAIAAHGGAAAFAALGALDLRLRCRGIALPSRGQAGALADVRAHVDLRLDRPRVRYSDWPQPGHAGVVDGWTTRIEREGAPLAERHGRRRRLLWDDLDVMHFAGYALWSYVTAPFLLASADVGVRELDGRRLALDFGAAGFPVHSRRQVVHLDQEGRIGRLDYTAEVFGRWARAANLCLAYETIAGVVIPTRRRVVPRAPGGRALPGPTLVGISLDDMEPHKDRGPGLRRGLDPVLH